MVSVLLLSLLVHAFNYVSSKNHVQTREQIQYVMLRDGISKQAEQIGESSTEPIQNQTDRSVRQVDINTASKEELMTVPSIGPVLAERIVAYREKHGDFKAIDEMINVKGIGRVTLIKIKTYLKISNQKNS
ncbi:helix-hairpin-helix domain-containing protein [candidate division KSB1 bacterium]|nr:helix-hairpin-helix domain-containing protein [candidate division KSB1 bacterium]